ncbi:MAG: hypothetical protein ACOX55_09420 [Christensenellales bacterium]|jgi:hypothetical protein
MKNAQLVYYPEKEFNGVLIILREPHIMDGESPKEAFIGNRRWFEHVISEKPTTGLMTRYRNRFGEMLRYCHKNNLSSVAFTNINLDGGGKTASSKYWGMEKAPILNDIIAAVKPEIVFMTRELFNIVSKDIQTQNGITYENGKVLRSIKIRETVFYEIYHPCYPRRIKI